MFSGSWNALKRCAAPVYKGVATAVNGTVRRNATVSDALKLGRLNHVAVAVPDLQAAADNWRTMGATVSAAQALPEHGVTTVFVELANTKIELLEPLGEASPIAGFLAKNANGGMHHVCVEVDDIDGALAHFQASGYRVLGSGTKIGAHGKPVFFVHPKDCNGVLVELEQS